MSHPTNDDPASGSGPTARGRVRTDSTSPPSGTDVEAEEIQTGLGRGPRQYWRDISPARRRVVAGAGIAVAAGSLVAAWFGWESAADWPVPRDLAYTVHDPASTTVRFAVTKPPEMTAECEVIAQEVGKAVVGRDTATIPPSLQPTTEHEVTLRTTTLAVHGSVRTCEPVE